ncbi:glycosyltransferase family 2 protein [Sphingomonas sp. ID0503]|uniref:glycosyltransferase family 2 protein n=1 Tax=Sphingomonas sp. ID0503 TaxID=3399691 RepID=UPI003AFA8AA1
MAKIGIALITYNRFDRARQVIGRVIEQTRSPIELVIADDGSTDGTGDWFRQAGFTVIGRENRGVCWNKNRGLYALLARGCETLLLLEDDIYPVEFGWEEEWDRATQAHDHLAYAHDKIAAQIVSGAGTAADPYVNNKATAQCTAVSLRAMQKVGFLDTRFHGYGVGHAEWTSRIKHVGYGFRRIELPDGRRPRANLYIKGGLLAEDAKSWRDNASVAVNKEIFKQLKSEPPFRMPWNDEAERAAFLEEQRAAGIDVSQVEAPGFFAPFEVRTPVETAA